MAFSTTLPTRHEQPYTAYNVDWAVGAIGSNMREDVMLVQALLRIVYYESLVLESPAESTGSIAVDGLCGPITRAHIVHFQRQAAERGYPVHQDGSFDPFRAGGKVSRLTSSRYCMELLNNGCYSADKENGTRFHKDLPLRDDIPVALRAALKTQKTEARQYTYAPPQTVPTTGGA